jgi:hypothetical protein
VVPAPTTAVIEAAPAPVHIALDSVPSGAEVRIEGQLRGTTPLSLELAPSATGADLVLTRRGFLTVTEHVALDVDQRLRVALVRAPATARRPAAADPGFERFD